MRTDTHMKELPTLNCQSLLTNVSMPARWSVKRVHLTCASRPVPFYVDSVQGSACLPMRRRAASAIPLRRRVAAIVSSAGRYLRPRVCVSDARAINSSCDRDCTGRKGNMGAQNGERAQVGQKAIPSRSMK
jgi:hypothetical protein